MFAGLRTRITARMALLARPRAAELLPVLLNRRRVYVLPTRFGLFYASVVFAMGLGALNYNNNPALMLVLLLMASGLASLIAAHLQLSGMRMDALSAEPVPAGEILTVQIAFSADDYRLRRGLQIRCLDHSAAVPALQQEPVVAVLPLPTMQRGWFDLGRIRLSTTQPLGLALAWSWIWPNMPLLVYPRPEAHGPPLPAGLGEAGVARLHPAGEDLHHLRAYRNGDPRRAIAWKASARRDSLLVREHEQPQSQEVALEWQSLSHLEHEQRISRLAHWVDQAERDGLRYRLHLPGYPVMGPDLGASHRHICLRALALMSNAY